MFKYASLSGSVLFLSACSSAPPPAEAPPQPVTSEPAPVVQQETPETESEVQEEEPEVKLIAAMPTSSCGDDAPCEPPQAFATEFCKGRYPGLAIVMFEKSTPWKRMYVNVDYLEHVNTYGGKTSGMLDYTEEVIILRHQGSGDSGGMTVSGSADVDVLRWDGTCATVREGALSEHRMATIKNASITWKYLDKATQQGLLQAKYVKVRYEQQREACRSSSASNPSAACAKATKKLNDAITVAVRGGLELPEPGSLPEWKPAE